MSSSMNAGQVGAFMSAGAFAAGLLYMISRGSGSKGTDSPCGIEADKLTSPAPTPQTTASPRNAGAQSKTSAEASAPGSSSENPWEISEGSRAYELGDVEELPFNVNQLLLLKGALRG